jgi:tRNA-Thr(GGU) m(6)t(6)A37 methyltransferase TsaA
MVNIGQSSRSYPIDAVSKTSRSSSCNMLFVAVAAGILASAGILCVFCQQRNEIQELKRQIAVQQEEKEEEKGMPAASCSSSSSKESEERERGSDEAIYDGGSSTAVVPIGTMRSVFQLCVGTPRQGLLVPNSRGMIQIDSAILASDCIMGLEHFSHLWVVFLFHLNTNQEKVRGSRSKKNHKMFPSKVAPPALGGKRVGIFTTRTPHRLNPIGFTLCQLDHVDILRNRLYVSGIDLVDGTPIVDMKPFVPYYDSIVPSSSVRLPEWISTGLEQRREVSFTFQSEQQLQKIVKSHQLQFYNNISKAGKISAEEEEEEEYQCVKSCIQQVLQVDVRSARQTRKARQGAFQAERALCGRVATDPTSSNGLLDETEESILQQPLLQQLPRPPLCTQQIDNMLIHFSVTPNPDISTYASSVADGSGCNDIIQVEYIELLQDKLKYSLEESAIGTNTYECSTLTQEESFHKEIYSRGKVKSTVVEVDAERGSTGALPYRPVPVPQSMPMTTRAASTALIEDYSLHVDDTELIKAITEDGKLSIMAAGDIILRHIDLPSPDQKKLLAQEEKIPTGYNNLVKYWLEKSTSPR